MTAPPIASTTIHAWDGVRAEVLSIDGDRWTVLDASGRPHVVSFADVEPSQLVAHPVAIIATHPARANVTRIDAAPGDGLAGEERRLWVQKRRAALLACVRLGWRVEALGVEDPKE